MSAMLNLGSILFGVIAWVLPIIFLVQFTSGKSTKWVGFSVVSLGACAVALGLQILEIKHRVELQDWSALMDTLPALATVSIVLLLITLTLNAAALAKYRQALAA